jgi:hypothetical protein
LPLGLYHARLCPREPFGLYTDAFAARVAFGLYQGTASAVPKEATKNGPLGPVVTL